MKDELIKLLSGINPKSFGGMIRKRPQVKAYLDQLSTQWCTENVNETIYCVMSDTVPQRCPCGKKALFNSYTKGYRKFCSSTCPSKGDNHSATMKKIWDDGGEQRVQGVVDKMRSTMLEKYGAVNPMHVDEIVGRVKQTNMERHGVETPFQSQAIRGKASETLLKNHGVETPFQSETIRKKAGETYERNHGKRNTMEHARQAFNERYGVDNAFQAEWVRERVKQRLNQRYGVDHPTKSPEIKERVVQTNLERYGVKNPAQRHLHPDLYDILCHREKFVALLTSYSVQEIKLMYGCSSDIVYDHHDRYGLDILTRVKSQYEEQIAGILDSMGVQYRRNTSILTAPNQVDFYIPDHHLAIEFNGLYWHSENSSGKGKDYHATKTRQCTEKAVQLLTIFEDEWIEHREIIAKHIQHLCGGTNQTIGARKIKIDSLSDRNVADAFLEQYHIQGKTNNYSMAYGGWYNGVLVSVFTLSRVSENEYDITRYCTNLEASYPGLFSKFIKHINRTTSIKRLTTIADLRWSVGNIYERSGFKLVSTIKPDYFYTDYHARYHKFGFRKKLIESKFGLSIEGKTERQLTEELGLDRIWDCGKLKFELMLDSGAKVEVECDHLNNSADKMNRQ
jgi:hypothetical protein